MIEWFRSDAILLHPPSQIALTALAAAAASGPAAELGSTGIAPLFDALCDGDATKRAGLDESIRRVEASIAIGSQLVAPELLAAAM